MRHLALILPLPLALAAAGAQAAGPLPTHPHLRPDFQLQQRQAIILTPEEAAHIRMEMQLFLAGVRMIVAGAAANDLTLVAGAARELGMAATHAVPAGLRGKLPLEFKQLGHATHTGFDDLARDSESLGDAQHALRQLAEVMSNCTACHATFRLETGKGGR